MRYLSHKIRIYPNYKAKTYLNKCFGVSRFAYNWALNQCNEDHKEGKKCPSGFDLSKRLTVAKKTEYPWMYEVSKWASQKAVYDLADSFKSFFDKRSKSPKYKKKGKCRDSFYLNSNAIKVENLGLKIPLLKSKIRMSQEVRIPGRVLSVTISRGADQFYPSSKLCSVCGSKNKELVLEDRSWTCSFCGTNHDRDLNAAMNLKQLALRYRDSINACGGLQDPKKQEAHIGVNHG